MTRLRRRLTDRTQWFPFMVGVGLAFFGMIASGVPPWMAGTAALLIAVGSGIWLAKPAEPPVREVTNWARVAELEHDTGIYDRAVRLGVDGHSEGVEDACRKCARAAVTQDMHRVGGYAALYDLDPAAEPGVHPGRGTVPEYQAPLEPPHGGFNTPCRCGDCNSLVQAFCPHPRRSVVKATSRNIHGSTVSVDYSCTACGAENIPGPTLPPLVDRTVNRTVPALRLQSLRTTEHGGWAIDDSCVTCGRETTAFMVVRPEPGDVVSFTCRDCLTYNKVTYER